MTDQAYTGTNQLEVLAHIENYNEFLTNLVAHRTSPARPGPVVDFGAGIGTFARKLRNQSYAIECVEIDPVLASRLSADGFEVKPSLKAYPDSSLSVIYTFNVLEHIEDDENVLRELWGKLAPGGQLIIYVPANRFLWTSLDDSVCHFRRYGRKELRRKLLTAGFNAPSVHYADSLGALASLVYKLMDPGDGRIDQGKALFYDRWIFPVSRRLDTLFRHITGKNLVAFATR